MTTIWLVLCLLLWASNAEPAVFVLGAAIAAASVVVIGLVDLAPAGVRSQWPRPKVWRPSHRDADRRTTKFRRDANAAINFDSTHIHDTLVQVIDDRLVAHHNISLSENSDEAMKALSPTLLRFVRHPDRTTTGVRELRKILSEIEAL